jgi:hypothetical protein
MSALAAQLKFDPVQHCYSVDGVVVPSVTQVLAPLNDYRWVRPDILDAARHLGTAVHTACDLDDQGTLDERTVQPVLLGFVAAWRLFCAEHRAAWRAIEQCVYHPAMGYAGRLDRLGTVDGIPTVVDLKTSARLSPAVGPQLAAYAKALPDPTCRIRRLAVQLRPDGRYIQREYADPMDWAVFASLLTLRTFCREHQITPRF